MRRKKVQLTPWGEFLANVCEERGTTPFALAKATRVSPSVLTYAMRKPSVGLKAYPPPLRHLNAWCQALGLSGAQKQRFLLLAWLQHAPEPLARYVFELEARIDHLSNSDLG